MGAATSPVKGPSFAQCTFCAPTAISLSARPVTAAARDVKGGNTEMSTLPSNPSTRRLSELQNSAVSLAVLFIFQFPAISMAQSSGITATPGNSFPSRSSSAAPPPVEAQSTLSISPISLSARIESAPPTTV